MNATASRDRLAIFGSALLFSTGGVAIKWLTFGAWQVAALRALVAAVAVWWLVPGKVVLWRRAVMLTGLAQAGSMLLFVLANKMTTAANAIFLQSAAPLFIPLLAASVLGERATRRDYVSMAGIAVGLSCFFVGAAEPTVTAPQPRLGDLLAVVSAVSWACTVVGLRYLARETGAPVVHDEDAEVRVEEGELGGSGAAKGALLWGNFFVVVLAMPLALPLPEADSSQWAILAFLGAGQVALAYRLLVSAVARVPALEASLLALFEPVLNPVWAFLFLGETPSSWALVGACILAGVTIARAAAGARERAA